MKERKQTKRALITSLLSMALCVVLLIGTTFAWFTDAVTSGGNKIVAGDLDVELYHTNKVDDKEPVGQTTKLFDDITLWEPGAVVYETFTVENKGDLALKYRFDLNQLAAEDFNIVTWAGDTNTYDLTDVVKVAVVEEVAFDGDREAAKQLIYKDWDEAASEAVVSAMLEPEMSNTFTVVLYWEPGAMDNFYNLNNAGWTLDKTNADGESVLFINAGVSLYATQAVSESDSFGPYYDGAAQIPNAPSVENDAAVVKTKNEEFAVYMQDVTPQGAGNTTLVFPSGSFAEADKRLQVDIKAKNLTAVNPNFQIDSTGMGVVGAFDITATLGGDAVTSFNGKKVEIITYIEKGLDADSLVLTYVDDNGVKTEDVDSNGDFAIVSYDAVTGRVVFETKHFSTYEFSAPLIRPIEEGVYGLESAVGLYVMANSDAGSTFVLQRSLVFDDATMEAAEELGIVIKNDITLDTGSFRMKLTKVPVEVGEGVTLTLIGEADVDAATFDSLKASAGTVKVQGCNFIERNPADLDASLKTDDSVYIAVNYEKDGKSCYIVNERATTVVLAPSGTTYASVNGNYTVKEVAGNNMYLEFSALKNNEFNTVYILPGIYNCTTTLDIFSSMDIIGLGDRNDIKIVKVGTSTDKTSASNRHLFNCKGEKSEYIQVTIRNLYLDATEDNYHKNKLGMKLTDDNAAVQCILKTKVKCYDLTVIKKSGAGHYGFYVNGNNKVDGTVYRAYLYVENTLCPTNTADPVSDPRTSGDVVFAHYNLTYDNGAKTYVGATTDKIQNIQMAPEDWEW